MKIQALREQRSTLATQARDLLDKNPGDSWNDDHQTEYDDLVTKIERVDASIANAQKQLDIEAQGVVAAQHNANANNVSIDEGQAMADKSKEIYVTWLRGGPSAFTNEQREYVAKHRGIHNTMSTTTDSEGGYLVPTEHSRTLLEEMLAFGGVRSVANVVITGDGAPIEWPTNNDTGNTGELLAENATAAVQDFAFGTKTIGGYKYSSKSVAVPMELLQDSAVDLEAFIRSALATRLARITNTHFTTGTGSSQPNGVVTASTSTATSAAAAAIAYADIVDLEHSLDPDYRDGASWMFNDSTLKAIKKLVDSTGRPLWAPGISSGEPDTIGRYPYTINQNMASIASTAKAMLFGNFRNYMVRDSLGVQLFRMTDSVYTTKGQVGFLAFSRHDGELMDAAGTTIRHLLQAT